MALNMSQFTKDYQKDSYNKTHFMTKILRG
jgi:hypothetical protein